MRISQRGPTSQTTRLAHRIGGPTVFARQACKPFRQGVGGFERCHHALDHGPGPLVELHAFDILGEVIQPAEQTKGIPQGRNGGLTQACRHAQPGLLADLHENAIFDGLQVNGQRRVPPGAGASTGGDLDRHLFRVPEDLGVHIATVEFRHQGVCDVIGFDVAVKNSTFHVFDYNPFTSDDDLSSYFMSLKNIYAMKQFWFKSLLGILMLTGLGLSGFLLPRQAEAYQDVSTPTGIFVTVTYTDPINVRSGPSTVQYPIVAQLNPGEVVPALGVSPKREWIQISYSGGTGWVYASFVSISGGELRIVEPPPTPTPVVATVDPTLAAAFNVQPTITRLPTFTPPAPLEEIDTSPHVTTPRTVAPGFFIMVLGLLGIVGLLVSFLLRR